MKERINRERLQLRDMSIGKKLIVSGYMIMTPILLLISMVVGIHNYRSVKESDRNRHLQTAGNINESITMLMGEMEDICTYISVNTNINRLLTDSKTKFKAYAMDEMPDVVSIWGQPAFLDEVLDAGVLAELNEDDYSDYNFVEGSTNRGF